MKTVEFLSLLLAVVPVVSAQGLDAKMKAKGKQYYGTCSDQNLLNNQQNANIIRTEFGAITPENSMKWQSIQPNRGSFTWGGADFLVNWAQTNGKMIRGHTLVWHSQLAGWVNNINDRNTMTSVIQNHVNTVMTRYKGKIAHWDVVNEMFDENGGIRNSPFSRVMGDSFVDVAFNAARAADPSAKLYINDYNLDSPNAKVNGMVNLVRRKKQAGVPIDGIGTQGHLSANGGGGMAGALAALAGVGGVEVAITELDVGGGTPSSFEMVTRACLQQPACVGITVWGVRDSDSWRQGENALLFDGNFNKKQAYNAVSNALN